MHKEKPPGQGPGVLRSRCRSGSEVQGVFPAALDIEHVLIFDRDRTTHTGTRAGDASSRSGESRVEMDQAEIKPDRDGRVRIPLRLNASLVPAEIRIALSRTRQTKAREPAGG